MNYLRDLRLKKARQLLEESDSFSTIAVTAMFVSKAFTQTQRKKDDIAFLGI